MSRILHKSCVRQSTVPYHVEVAEQELGADETVDYAKEDFGTMYMDKPFDVIMDSVGGAAYVNTHAITEHCY